MFDQIDSKGLFSDQNILFSQTRFSNGPIDWNNLSNNSTSSLIDICHEFHITIRKPIIKQELVNSIKENLKNTNVSSLNLSPSYDYINGILIKNSSENTDSTSLNRVPESYCQQTPSISSFFGTSSSFQPLVASPFSQMLKKWKQHETAAASQKPKSSPVKIATDFKPIQPNNNKNINNNNRFQYSKEDIGIENSKNQPIKIEQFQPSPKNQKSKQNYSKQKNQLNQQKTKNQIIPEPSQIVFNKNAFQNMPQQQEIQQRSPSSFRPVIITSKASTTKDDSKGTTTITTGLKITNESNKNKQENSSVLPSKENENVKQEPKKSPQSDQIKKNNTNKLNITNLPSKDKSSKNQYPSNRFISLQDQNQAENKQQETKSDKNVKDAKSIEKVEDSEPIEKVEDAKSKEKVELKEDFKDHAKEASDKNQEQSSDLTKTENNETDKDHKKKEAEKAKKQESPNKFMSFLTNLFTNRPENDSENGKNSAEKEEIVYKEIAKNKKKKKNQLDFFGFSIQQQKLFFRVVFLVIHAILLLIFFCVNDFDLTIPYRL